MDMTQKLKLSIAVLLFSALACEPVFAIGWEELLVFFVLFLILLGPPLYRFMRALERFLKRGKEE
jgi:hypothetical protein